MIVLYFDFVKKRVEFFSNPPMIDSVVNVHIEKEQTTYSVT